MPLILTGGHVWNGLDDETRDTPLTIDGDTIAALDASPAADTIDVSGCTILPGLIEGHAHLCFNAAADWRTIFDSDSSSRMLLRMSRAAASMLQVGITTVRDLGAPTTLAVELRDAVRDGLVSGPDLLVAGAPVTTTGGHCWFLGGEADGELGARIRVRELAKAGVDWIKVMATGGGMTPGTNVNEPQYSLDELRAIVDEASRLGLRVAAHCHGTPGIRNAVEAGVATIEHCSFRTPQGLQIDPDLVAQIAASRIAVSPTVHAGYLSGKATTFNAQRIDVARAIVDAGCTILMSTDCGIPNTPHDVLPRSIHAWSELTGMPPLDTLRAATSGAALILGLADRGVIAPGQRADLLVVEGDPLEDLTALQRVRCVVRAGVVVRG